MFNRNIEALKHHLIPEFIEKIEKANLPEWVELIKSEDNTDNLLIVKGTKRKSLYPIEGWKKEADARLKDFSFNSSNATMIIGIGLGYFLQEALNKAEDKHIIIVVESEPGLLKAALQRIDISKAIKEEKLMIAPTIDDLSYMLELINEKYVIDDWATCIEGYTIDNHAYQQISFEALSILNQTRCNIGTVANAGKQIADNDISNLPYVIHRRGVRELEGLYKGLPAILVSTGPSLSKNLHLLIEAQENAIIIAVGQALRPLLAYGINPDFICSVDYGEVNLTHYEGLMESNIPLVALNRSFAPLLKRWQGPMFVACSPQIDMHPDHKNRIHKILSDKGWTLQGGSVAHMCYGLSILLGCSPLIMIGQDLAYDSEQSHFQQADSRGILKRSEQGDIKWEVQDPRCHLNKVQDISMGPPIPVAGYFGGEVITNVGLASFITSFERFIKGMDSHVINATEGGANIQGAKRMSLKRALETYCKDKIEDKRDKLKPLLSNCSNALELVDESIPLLEKEISLLNECQVNAKKALDTNSKLKALTLKKLKKDQTDKFNKLLSSNKLYSDNAHNIAVRLPLVILALYGATRKINHAAMKVDGNQDHILTSLEDAKIRIERNRIILQAAFDACKQLKQSYKETLQQLTKVSEARDLSLLIPKQKEPEPNIEDAEQYFAVGNFARPMLEASKFKLIDENATDVLLKAYRLFNEAIKKAKELPDNSDTIESIQLMFDAQEIGRKEKDFTKAKEMLEKAVDKSPTNEVARWGLATVHFQIKEYEKSIPIYNQLVKEYPEKKRYKFELGQVLVCDGETKEDTSKIIYGIDTILEAMNGAEEFDSFLPIIADLLCNLKKHGEAIVHYKEYLKKYPADYEVWLKLSSAALVCDKEDLAIEAKAKAKAIKGISE
ncbi:hypothetical protein A2619_04485 [candidate division WWE3 bacterium RIFOXYD1_FULL_39_9]|uniref:6-hydroxymethylpterin diphosphokinase MptE-like domain-containing protein n=1 Tax=candidate division WWE3 bacterium RIFOXYD1_FULL_39_9 TaxID=1802649 RepID=A0A1F4X6D5_UNCKA|nr:MAG: hypothetical protein A2619_04485 [candidate division WWE3 bacterium RIFOXYD1_FULL_39_9]